ncbi:MAG: hypothetical protein ACAH59_10360 [Pseudobdellovibrionaceae bacterium]
MPEIAAISLVGAIVTFIAVNWNLYRVHQSFKQSNYEILNHNLSQVGKYWSLEQGRVLEMKPEENFESMRMKDYQKSTRSAFVFGTLMIFLSWLGFLIFAIYFLSTNKWVKSRLEQRIFSSDLVKNKNLSQNQIQNLLQELESLTG